MPVSIRPSDARPSAFLDGAYAEIAKARFAIWNYDGKEDPATREPYGEGLFVKILFTGDEMPKGQQIQYYSAGDIKFFAPSKDGKTLIEKGSRTELPDNCNFVFFMENWTNAGGIEEKLGEDVSALEGTAGTLKSVDQPERSGLQEKRRPILVFDEIDKLPWQKAKKAGGGKRKGPVEVKKEAPATADTGEPSGDKNEEVQSQAQSLVLELLAEAGDAGIKKSTLPSVLFKVAATREDLLGVRKEIVKLAGDAAFLNGGPWSVEDGVLSLG